MLLNGESATTAGAISTATRFITLINGLIAGPAVSLNGSPTVSPIAVGFGLGIGALAGFLAGAIGSGTLMAVFLANAGGAWDNAKKLVEDGHHGGKGSPAHEATIIGDTVGDPFKDTAGPAINPLIKVMNLVAVLIAPAVVAMSPLSETPSAWRFAIALVAFCLLYTSPSPRDQRGSRMPSSA